MRQTIRLPRPEDISYLMSKLIIEHENVIPIPET